MRENSGIWAGVVFLIIWVIGVGAALTGTLDDLVVWIFGMELLKTIGAWLTAIVIAAIVILVGKVSGGSHAHSRVERRGNTLTVHRSAPRNWNGDPKEQAVEHELIHAGVGRHCKGWRVLKVIVRKDGSGLTRFKVPCRTYSPIDDAAITAAPRWAGDNPDACSSDMAYLKSLNLSRQELAQARRRANAGMSSSSGWRSRHAGTLLRRGKI